MERIYILVVLLVVIVAVCLLNSNQQQFQQCVATASARYPSSRPIPTGQPYQDIYACMIAQGYALDTQSLHCANNDDETKTIMDPQCYRPTNIFRGYVHDVVSVLR